MYKKNRRSSVKYQVYGSYQTLYLTEKFELRTAYFLYTEPLYAICPN